MVAAGHYLAAAVGLRVLEAGGNAVDAGVATGFALSLLKPQSVGIGGEVPILIHLAREQTIGRDQRPGLGAARRDDRLVPPAQHLAHPVRWLSARHRPGPVRIVVHRAAAVRDGRPEGRARARGRHGRRRLPDVHRAAQQHRESRRALSHRVADLGRDLPARWSGARGRHAHQEPRLGALAQGRHRRQPARSARATRASRPRSTTSTAGRSPSRRSSSRRRTSSKMARAPRTAACSSEEDWAAYGTRGTQVEEPVSVTYRGVEVLKCGPWSQGPVLPAAAQAARGLRPGRARPQLRRVPAHLPRVRQARLRRSRALLRRSRVRRRAAASVCSPTSTRPSGARLIDPERASLRAAPRRGATPAVTLRPLAGRDRRHHPRRRGRSLGQPVRGHAERRLDRLVAGRRRARLPARHARPDVLPRREARQRAAARQAAAHDAVAVAGAAQRPAVARLRHARAATSRTSGRCSSS